MLPLPLDHVIDLIICGLSFILYLVVLFTIYRDRHNQYMNSTYFRLCLVHVRLYRTPALNQGIAFLGVGGHRLLLVHPLNARQEVRLLRLGISPSSKALAEGVLHRRLPFQTHAADWRCPLFNESLLRLQNGIVS